MLRMAISPPASKKGCEMRATIANGFDYVELSWPDSLPTITSNTAMKTALNAATSLHPIGSPRMASPRKESTRKKKTSMVRSTMTMAMNKKN